MRVKNGRGAGAVHEQVGSKLCAIVADDLVDESIARAKGYVGKARSMHADADMQRIIADQCGIAFERQLQAEFDPA